MRFPLLPINILLLFLFYSCSDKRKEMLTSSKQGSTGKYWDVLKRHSIVYEVPVYCYRFNEDGVCFYYHYSWGAKDARKRELFDFGDVIYPNTWKLNNDTLQIQGFDRILLKLEEDSMILINSKNIFDTIILIRSLEKLDLL